MTSSREPGRLSSLAPLITLAGPPTDMAEVRTPFDGSLLGEIPLGSAADVAEAMRRGRTAQRVWAGVPVKDRCRVLFRFRDLLLERWAEVLDVVQIETGKARRHAAEELMDIALVAGH